LRDHCTAVARRRERNDRGQSFHERGCGHMERRITLAW
jgi:hypothetical protein